MKYIKMIICVTLMLIMVFSMVGCSAEKKVVLSHENGAQVEVVVRDMARGAVSEMQGGLKVSSSSGEVAIKLMSSGEAGDLSSEYMSDPSFTELTTEFGTGMSYMTAEGRMVHMFPVDDNTFLVLTAGSDEAMFDVEGKMTFTSVTEGVATIDEFSSHFGLN